MIQLLGMTVEQLLHLIGLSATPANIQECNAIKYDANKLHQACLAACTDHMNLKRAQRKRIYYDPSHLLESWVSKWLPLRTASSGLCNILHESASNLQTYLASRRRLLEVAGGPSQLPFTYHRIGTLPQNIPLNTLAHQLGGFISKQMEIHLSIPAGQHLLQQVNAAQDSILLPKHLYLIHRWVAEYTLIISLAYSAFSRHRVQLHMLHQSNGKAQIQQAIGYANLCSLTGKGAAIFPLAALFRYIAIEIDCTQQIFRDVEEAPIHQRSHVMCSAIIAISCILHSALDALGMIEDYTKDTDLMDHPDHTYVSELADVAESEKTSAKALEDTRDLLTQLIKRVRFVLAQLKIIRRYIDYPYRLAKAITRQQTDNAATLVIDCSVAYWGWAQQHLFALNNLLVDSIAQGYDSKTFCQSFGIEAAWTFSKLLDPYDTTTTLEGDEFTGEIMTWPWLPADDFGTAPQYNASGCHTPAGQLLRYTKSVGDFFRSVCSLDFHCAKVTFDDVFICTYTQRSTLESTVLSFMVLMEGGIAPVKATSAFTPIQTTEKARHVQELATTVRDTPVHHSAPAQDTTSQHPDLPQSQGTTTTQLENPQELECASTMVQLKHIPARDQFPLRRDTRAALRHLCKTKLYKEIPNACRTVQDVSDYMMQQPYFYITCQGQPKLLLKWAENARLEILENTWINIPLLRPRLTGVSDPIWEGFLTYGTNCCVARLRASFHCKSRIINKEDPRIKLLLKTKALEISTSRNPDDNIVAAAEDGIRDER